MSTNRILQIASESSEATEQLAEALARNLKGGTVLELTSDLGGGKTTFVRGLARGLGSPDHVSSPTFKLSNIYNVPEKEIPAWDDVQRLYHYDFYRLPDAGLMGHELHEALSDANGVVVVEWGKVVAKVLPKDRISIRFVVSDEHKRFIIIDCPPGLEYVLEGLS
jgi:tRNA threonylcarbamoyladenosine biosynthesis protein TsaE